MVGGRADHGVHLPVAELLAVFDRRWSLGDVAFSREAAALFVGAIALAVLRSLSEATEEGSPASLVVPDTLVDGFMADAEHLITSEPAADLLGAEVGSNQLLNQLPLLVGEPAVPSRAGPAAVGLLLGSGRPVRSVVGRAVASQLSADGAGVSAHEVGDGYVGELWLLFPQRGERIPLLAGDLVITHDDPFLVEDSSVSQIAPFFS